jgi:hypothetical protein
MRTSHTPRDARGRYVQQRVAPTTVQRDAHIERLRSQQRPDQSNFDDADLSVSPAQRPVVSPSARLTPAQVQEAVNELRQQLASPLPIPSPTASSAPPGPSQSLRPTASNSLSGNDLRTDQQAQTEINEYTIDDESRDVVHVDTRSTLQGRAAPQAASFTPLPIGSVTPGGATHTVLNQLVAMQQQLQAVMSRLDRVTQERDNDRDELQRLRSTTQEQEKGQQSRGDKHTVKREDVTSVPFPSLSPFNSPVPPSASAPSPSTVLHARKMERIEEHKYDDSAPERRPAVDHKVTYDDSVHERKHTVSDDIKIKTGDIPRERPRVPTHTRQELRMSDLPDTVDDTSSDESDEDAVSRRDRQPDKMIRVPEDQDEDHLDSYPEWAMRREQLFPYRDPRNYKMYSTRHTLLSTQGRRMEWMRTAVHTRFHAALFGRSARRWFEAAMQTLGAPLRTAASQRYRTIDLSRPPPCHVPEMAYDPRDVVAITNDDHEPDLEPDSFTFERLPRPLRRDPEDHERAHAHTHSLMELIRQHARHTQLRRAAQGPDASTRPHKQTSEDEDSRPCKRCKTRRVYGLKVHCHTCEDEIAAWKREQVDRSWMPAMEQDPALCVKTEPAATVKLEPYGTQPSMTKATRVAGRKHMTYREQEQELTILGERTRDKLRNDNSTDADLREEEESPLGTVLSVVFQPHQRPLLRRIARDDLLTFRDRHAALTAATQVIAKFDGTTSKAPKYMQDLCTQVQTYKFTEQEIMTLMNKTMIDAANMWLQTNLAEVFQLPDKPIQALLMRFKSHYVGAHVVRDIRKQLASTVLTTATPTLKDLDTHYASYNALLTQLRFSDRFVDDKEVLTEYFASLPLSLRTFIGSSFDRLTSINELHREAQKALVLLGNKTSSRTDAQLITVNAVPVVPDRSDKSDRNRRDQHKNSSNRRDSSSSRDSTVSNNLKNALCYHCGDKGHWTGRCPLRKGPQTTKGKAVWARRNQERGSDWPYNLQWYVELSDKYESDAARRKTSRPGGRTHKNKERDTITIEDDKSGAEEMYDDE